MKYYTVYKITNLINNYIYIGCHSTNKLTDNYIGSGTNIKNAIKEFGKSNFTKQILFIFNNKEEMLAKEKELVNAEFIERTDTYNIILGGSTFLTIDCVSVKDKYGNNMMVHKNDERYLSGELNHINKNKIIAIDKNGNTFQIDKNDERYLSGELISINKTKIIVIDKEGKKYKITKDDPRYISGELFSILKGYVSVKDKNGNTFQIDKNDERYLSGELNHINKNLINAIDKDGKIFKITKDDPRYLSGKLVGSNKGKTWKHKTGTKKGVHNSCYGKRLMYNLITKEKKFIKLNDIEIYISNGWTLGKFSK